MSVRLATQGAQRGSDRAISGTSLMESEPFSGKMVLFTNCTAARCHCSIKTVTGWEVVGGLSYCQADNELFHILC